MQSSTIRSIFVSYFRNQEHIYLPSSPLVPAQDQTLLFTNSGMVQFKDVFLGQRSSQYQRAVTVQRCLRAGGKHNDLDNVGYTARHHTFFEMMGNFSFGDYFKEEAISFAWDFVRKVLKLPEEKLWITVHHTDKEAEAIWLDRLGVSAHRFSRLDDDNFWSMGNTGPCGPCSEIFYDHGPEVEGGPPGSPDEDGDRYVEIWNLVFMQYQRDEQGKMTPLAKPCIDTGMGLERIAAVLQNKISNYDTDLFIPILEHSADLLNCTERDCPSLKVIADHIRSCAFLINDGITPSNEGRGYVLRRIIRRAIRHGYTLGSRDVFFAKLLPTLIDTFSGSDYSDDIQAASDRICQTLDSEENQFRGTLEMGMTLLDRHLHNNTSTTIGGDTIFRLYDTFGFPVDLTGDIARERGMTLDMQGFNQCMKQQQQQSKANQTFHTINIDLPSIVDIHSNFVGYDKYAIDTKIIAIVCQGESLDRLARLNPELSTWLLLEDTPFYAESGGQIGDIGNITAKTWQATVKDTIKHGDNHWHLIGQLEGQIKVGDGVQAAIDQQRRCKITRNHSATHLLHSALRNHLGETVMQRGSQVSAEKLRFDFSANQALTSEQLASVEMEVNSQILGNHRVTAQTMSMNQAKQAKAIAFFEEKYGDRVRVLSMGKNKPNEQNTNEQLPYSVELCGGSHVARTGDIGSFHIIHESSIASGIRRIEAITGDAVIDWLRNIEEKQLQSSALLKTDSGGLVDSINNLIEHNRNLHKQVQDLQARMASGGNDNKVKIEKINGIKAIIKRIDGVNPVALRSAMDQYKSQLGEGVVLLAGEHNGKIAMVAGVTNNLTNKYSANNWLKQIACLVEGKAGGRADMAQGGGSRVEDIDEMIAKAADLLKPNTVSND